MKLVMWFYNKFKVIKVDIILSVDIYIFYLIIKFVCNIIKNKIRDDLKQINMWTSKSKVNQYWSASKLNMSYLKLLNRRRLDEMIRLD